MKLNTSKSFLLIDTPISCNACPCSHDLYWGLVCGKENKYVDTNYIFGKGHIIPDWCPLKSMPEKKTVPQYCGNGVYGFKTAEKAHYAIGWNDCIDEVLKGVD
jgi:hypothetical protein